jgi:hypothetical protein
LNGERVETVAVRHYATDVATLVNSYPAGVRVYDYVTGTLLATSDEDGVRFFDILKAGVAARSGRAAFGEEW